MPFVKYQGLGNDFILIDNSTLPCSIVGGECNKPNLRYDDAASSGSAARSRYTMTQARDVTAATDHLKLAQTLTSISGTKFVCLMCTLTIVSSGEKPAPDI